MKFILQTNLYLILFYGFYYFFLRKETFHQQNRAFLVGSALLSFGIPFWYSEYVQSFFITQQMNNPIYSYLPIEYVLVQKVSNSTSTTIYDILQFLYWAFVLFFLVRLAFNFWALNQIIQSKTTKKQAFSFFQFVFVDKDLQNKETILAHEKVHARQLHSFDVILFEVIAVLSWFNPVVYFYKKAIKNIHEFIADEIASKKEKSKADYALLLLSSQFGVMLNSHNLSNHFFSKSTLKQRIEMLNKPRSKKTAIMKYGFIAPLFFFMLVVASASIAKNETIENLSSIIETKTIDFENQKGDKVKVSEEKNQIKVFGKVVSTLDNQPLVGVSISVKGETNGTTTDSEGKYTISNISENSSLVFGLVGFQSQTISVGKQREINVSLLPQNTVSEKVFTTVEENPQFEGGVKELFHHIGREIKYPKQAKDGNIEGKVFIKFVVGQDGNVYNPTVLKGIGGGCDEEALRVIQTTSGKWIAGKQNGKKVNVVFTIPISYILETSKPEDEVQKLNEIVVATYKNQTTEMPIGVRSQIREKNILNPKGLVTISQMDIVTNHKNASNLIVIDGKPIDGNRVNLKPHEISSMEVIDNESMVGIYGEKARNGVVFIKTKKEFGFFDSVLPPQPIYFVNEKEINKIEADLIEPESIESVTVLKSEAAIKAYGEKGKNGVVIIKLKK